MEKFTAEKLVDTFSNNSIQYETLEAKTKVDYKKNGKGLNVKATVRILKDEKIWISGGLFGFEGARALITPDSVHVINRMNRTYYSESIDKVEELTGLPVDFKLLQQLLTGQLLIKDNSSLALEYEDDQIELISTYNQFATLAYLLADPIQLKQQNLVDQDKEQQVKILYSDYQMVDQQHSFPFQSAIEVSGKDSITVNLQINSLKIDNNPDFSFSINDGYTRETL